MNIATPKKIKMASVDLHKAALQARHDFADFMRESGLHDVIFGHLQANHAAAMRYGTYFVGGSQSWKQWATYNVPSSTSLTPQERASLVAGNADVFYVTNTAIDCKDFMCDIYRNMAKAIKADCDALLAKQGYPYTVSLSTHGFKASNRGCTFGAPVQYTIFPSYSIMFTLDSGKNKRTTRSRAPDAVIAAEQAPFHGKLMFYVEVGHVDNLNLKDMEKAYFTAYDGSPIPYLAPLGLMTFAMMIGQSRTSEKGIDVDTLRRQVFIKAYPDMASIFHHIADRYVSLFKHCPTVFHDSFVNMVRMESMKARDVRIDSLCDTFEQWFMERMRPFINAFIYFTEQEIATKTNHRAFMFIVGGDAMRRYKKSISATKDIDTKVYVDRSVRASDVTKIVRKNMARLITFLIKNKAHIFADIPHTNVGFGAQGMRAQITFLTHNKHNLQFRLREIKKSQFTLPVNLFSIDYRAYFEGSYVERSHDGHMVEHKVALKYDVPILDVAVQDNLKDKTPESILMRTANGLPVASLKFLLEDILNTYENDSLAAMRAFARKRGKDLQRFHHLRDVYAKRLAGAPKSKSSTPTQEIMGTRVVLDAVSPQALTYLQAPDPVAAKYEKRFAELQQKRNVYKYKMSFDQDLIGFPVEVDKPRALPNDEVMHSMSRSSAMSIDSPRRSRSRSRSNSAMSVDGSNGARAMSID